MLSPSRAPGLLEIRPWGLVVPGELLQGRISIGIPVLHHFYKSVGFPEEFENVVFEGDCVPKHCLKDLRHVYQALNCRVCRHSVCALFQIKFPLETRISIWINPELKNPFL